ncbi:hypothetical protein AB395_0000176 [Sinorhizobium fredii CCBAU 45436]|nr:hypothetical protein AB395_0000176 [Sinorhizobium fredii CCBAU 45436]
MVAAFGEHLGVIGAAIGDQIAGGELVSGHRGGRLGCDGRFWRRTRQNTSGI